jgi:hypothetical protein
MSMISPLEAAYQRYDEPIQGCLWAARSVLLQAEPLLTESLKYGMPFFSYRTKVCCYFWVDKKRQWPYIGWMDGRWLEHALLESGERRRIKVLWLDPQHDLPVASIREVLLLSKNRIDEKLDQ